MPNAVVDQLKIIEVDLHKDLIVTLGLHGAQRGFERSDELLTVDQFRDRIVRGLVHQLLGDAVLQGDVAEGDGSADGRAERLVARDTGP